MDAVEVCHVIMVCWLACTADNLPIISQSQQRPSLPAGLQADSGAWQGPLWEGTQTLLLTEVL